MSGSVITQVVFDAERVLSWVAEMREHGVELPVRVGVPGPASVKLLLGYASRLGVSTSATIVKKYGLSVTNLLGKAGPENFLRHLQEGLDPGKHGVVKLHFYTFGGFKTTAEWIDGHCGEFLAGLAAAGRDAPNLRRPAAGLRRRPSASAPS